MMCFYLGRRLGRLFNPRLALLDCCSLCSSKTLFRFEKYGLMGEYRARSKIGRLTTDFHTSLSLLFPER